jgi:hypothetical protein
MSPNEKPELGQYLSITEACTLLRISRPTFNKIRKEKMLRQFWFGKRPRFLKEDIIKMGAATPVKKIAPDTRLNLDAFTELSPAAICEEPHRFDLRRIRQFDSHGLLTLLCAIIDDVRLGHTVQLDLEDSFVCNGLRDLGFFQELERRCGDKVVFDKSILRTNYSEFQYPLPLTNVQFRKGEAPILEKLIKLIKEQGFSDAIGGYIGWIYGELVDNSITHLTQSSDVADCYLLAQRFKFREGGSECITISIADVGPGIHGTLKKNPKYAQLSDRDAFLTAFKPHVSSWGDEYKRGKGLTDILSIAMGNKAVIRAESGQNVWRGDFRDSDHSIRQDDKLPRGTRVSLVLIDHKFETKTYQEASAQIDELIKGK